MDESAIKFWVGTSPDDPYSILVDVCDWRIANTFIVEYLQRNDPKTQLFKNKFRGLRSEMDYRSVADVLCSILDFSEIRYSIEFSCDPKNKLVMNYVVKVLDRTLNSSDVRKWLESDLWIEHYVKPTYQTATVSSADFFSHKTYTVNMVPVVMTYVGGDKIVSKPNLTNSFSVLRYCQHPGGQA
jgi:hypothetical protein